jgi:transketolase
MGMADIAEVLWNDYLRHNPANPQWPDRDRFVLSNGHGSMLLYSLLHLTGYDLPLKELKNFRQLHSMTPGHPEYGHAPGVETTTGPLGQGLANAVGMALAERTLAARFNRPEHRIVDHHTYVFAGDGCLMEGISHEACSLAGHLGLGKLIVLYDDNGISIDGDVRGWFTDDTVKRFEAYGWHVVPSVDGHDANAVKVALEAARSERERPSLICCRTVIGFGSPNKAGTAGVHGAALGEAEVAASREQLGWHHPPFVVPEELRSAWDARERGAALETEWRDRFAAYRDAHPELAAELERRLAGDLPEDWSTLVEHILRDTAEKAPSLASRAASQQALEAYGPALPELIGGSADLTGSNNTKRKDSIAVTSDPGGNYIYYGVREFGMAAIMNGLALHGGFIPYGGTFLIFSDYARNAIRLSALMKQQVIYVLTHDSIGLGEDGPTHQPIEQLASLRLIPGLTVWRPADAVETAAAWAAAIEQRDGPSALALSRQKLAHCERTPQQLAAIRRGGYVLHEPDGAPEALIIATGSEVELALQAARQLAEEGRAVRVVSMPSSEIFEAQPVDYRESVLPAALTRRLVIEAGSTGLWYKYAGLHGRVVGLDQFGASAPAEQLFEHFGFSVNNIVDQLNALFAQ